MVKSNQLIPDNRGASNETIFHRARVLCPTTEPFLFAIIQLVGLFCIPVFRIGVNPYLPIRVDTGALITNYIIINRRIPNRLAMLKILAAHLAAAHTCYPDTDITI